ncbi:hypothetical protein K1F50_19185 [Muricauda oceani]|uniref:Uncharacterized protein n=1 Tax=Flagellimonas oceani TaxID=2698672 RepID=A0A6G7IY92_9FLAO|nr:hypothetical protein [Allomuricauda oceani]MBW8244939.1 hypothetical protein [Allomuricauda oceani]QII43359.1 hypothetical protein GVT53_01185 [Allomuricauda oceani]
MFNNTFENYQSIVIKKDHIMRTKIYMLLLCCTLFFQFSCTQKRKNDNQMQELPFTQFQWNVVDKEGNEQFIDTVEYNDKIALHLPKGHIAYLKNKTFKDFEIEFDVIGFVMPGLGFRGQDKENYELIYFRENSSNKKDALQYIPIFNGSLPWQLYNYPKYEASATFMEEKIASFPLSIENYLKMGVISDSLRLKLKEKGVGYSPNAQVQLVNEKTWGIGDAEQFKGSFLRKTATNWELWNPNVWSHIKIIVVGDRASVYVLDMEVPKMTVKLKRDVKAGDISLRNQFFDAFFTNVSIKDLGDGTLSIKNNREDVLSDNYIKKWQISPKFIKNENGTLSQLDSIQENDATWKSVETDVDGLLNVSRFIGQMKGSVALKTTIHSESKQDVGMHIGFAKHLIVLLNNEVIFNKEMDMEKEEGRVFVDNESLNLNLLQGKNNLLMILTGDEQYQQNWGIIAKLDKLKGIQMD